MGRSRAVRPNEQSSQHETAVGRPPAPASARLRLRLTSRLALPTCGSARRTTALDGRSLSCRQMIAIIASWGIKRATPKTINCADMIASTPLASDATNMATGRAQPCVIRHDPASRGDEMGNPKLARRLRPDLSSSARGAPCFRLSSSQLSLAPYRVSTSNMFAAALALTAHDLRHVRADGIDRAAAEMAAYPAGIRNECANAVSIAPESSYS